MDASCFNDAAALFARDPPAGCLGTSSWLVRTETDALGQPHAVLTSTWIRTRTNAPAATVPASLAPESNSPWMSDDDDADVDAAGEGNAAAIPVSSAAHGATDEFEVTISWSPAFRMPAVYFTLRCDGSPQPCDALALRDKHCPWLNVDGSTTSSALVTPTVHELLGRVMYAVHPCDIHMLLDAMLLAPGSGAGGGSPSDRMRAAITFVVRFVVTLLRVGRAD